MLTLERYKQKFKSNKKVKIMGLNYVAIYYTRLVKLSEQIYTVSFYY